MIKCAMCKYWENQLEAGKDTGSGVCRRHAPSPSVIARSGGSVATLVWPRTTRQEGCAEGEEADQGMPQ